MKSNKTTSGTSWSTVIYNVHKQTHTHRQSCNETLSRVCRSKSSRILYTKKEKVEDSTSKLLSLLKGSQNAASLWEKRIRTLPHCKRKNVTSFLQGYQVTNCIGKSTKLQLTEVNSKELNSNSTGYTSYITRM